MLQFAFSPTSSQVQPTGLMQAWAGVDAMYRKREGALANALSIHGEEKIVQTWPNGIGNYDGGIAVIQSGKDAYCFIGPGSGLGDYLAWALLSVSAIADASVQAWVNTLWAGYLNTISGQVSSAIRRALQPGGRVQIVGFSLGGAMAILLGRFLGIDPTINVSVVGFGTPRAITNSVIPPASNQQNFRIVNQVDPVDLLPLTTLINPEGGPLPSLPEPTAWMDYGTRFVLNGGTLTQINDPPSPTISVLVALFPFNIVNHSAGQHTQSISAFFSEQAAKGNTADGGAAYSLLAQAVDGNQPFPRFEQQIIFRPLPPAIANKDNPFPPPPQTLGPMLIQPFFGPYAPSTGSYSLPAGMQNDPH